VRVIRRMPDVRRVTRTIAAHARDERDEPVVDDNDDEDPNPD